MRRRNKRLIWGGGWRGLCLGFGRVEIEGNPFVGIRLQQGIVAYYPWDLHQECDKLLRRGLIVQQRPHLLFFLRWNGVSDGYYVHGFLLFV